jgi:hypothetical protein
MIEKNYRRLREALDRLPDYPAPASNWQEIDEALGPALKATLPTYAPPPEEWNAVSKKLDSTSTEPAVRPIDPYRWLAIAASVLIILSVAFFLLRQERGPTVSYAYTQEASPAPVITDWDDDESSFDRARREVQQRNEPHLNNLGHELEELSSAREEVKAMLVAYGEDPTIIRQLAEIERERDDVYRRLITEL